MALNKSGNYKGGKELVKYSKGVKDKVTKIKLAEVTNQIVRLSKGSTVKDKQVLGMMRYYQLLKEVFTVESAADQIVQKIQSQN